MKFTFSSSIDTYIFPIAIREVIMASPDPTMVWKENYTWIIIKFAIATVVLGASLIMVFTLGNLQEIAKNFPRYRCYPVFMPFASQFGYDTKENFNFCLNGIFNTKAAEIFQPIFKLLTGFTEIIKLIVDVGLGIRKLFSNFLLGVNKFIRNVRDRIQFLLFNIRMSFVKMNNLMGKVYGTMYAVIWMGSSALTAGLNIADNDLVKFLFEFCFDPETPVQLRDGSFIPIKEVKIGTKLASVIGNPEPVVTSVFRFNGENTPMVQIADVIVSASHFIKNNINGKMIPADEHPYAFCTRSLPELVCLNVTGNLFSAGRSQMLVADYDEHQSVSVIEEAQRIAIRALNGRDCNSCNSVAEYDIGIDGLFTVKMESGSWKPISKINLGDTVWNAGKVLGVVQETCSAVMHNNRFLSVAQLVYNTEKNIWERATQRLPDSDVTKVILYSLITEKCSTIEIRDDTNETYFIRDYREVPLPEMETPYAELFFGT